MPAPPLEPRRDETGRDDHEGLMAVGDLGAQTDVLVSEEMAIDEASRLEEELGGDAEGGATERKLGIVFWVAVGWLVLLGLAALLADLLPLADPLLQPQGSALRQEKNLPPLSTRLDGTMAILGTDSLGRDLLSRSIHGARVSLAVGFASMFFGTLIGTTIGLTAGYFRKGLDAVSMAAMDILLAFPALLLALAIVAIRGKGPMNATIALTIVAVPTIARLTRANTLVFAQREFVVAARTLGASNLRVLTREILPNVGLALLPFIPLGIAVAITAEGALAYLGQSVELPEPSLGGMISEGRANLIDGQWWVPMVPITFLVITLVSLNFIGDRLREHFGIKEGVL
jgi:peptide/nickel transport system permease protein